MVHVKGTRVRIPLPVRLAYRYFITGDVLRGPGDNATFLYDATQDYRGRPYEKLTKAKWRRLARRHAAITAPVGLAGLTPWLGTWPVLGYEAGLGTTVTAWSAYRAHQAVVSAKVHRMIDPAARTLCAAIGAKYRKKDARHLFQVPKGWSLDAEVVEPIRITVPVDKPLTKAQEKSLVAAVGGRLGITEATGSWFYAGEQVTVDITGQPLPPRDVTLADLMKHIEAALPTEVVVGLKAGRVPVTVSLAEDSPHFAMSGPSGTGKSVLIKVFMAQRINKGDGAIFLDPKRWSHWRWASKLPSDKARYAYKIEDIHAAWLEIGQELQRRIELDEDELEHLRRVFVVIEEINRQTAKLTAFWKAERRRRMNLAKAMLADAIDRCDGDKIDGMALALAEGMAEDDLDLPLQSPAIAAMQDLVGMGREMRMHAVVAAQRLSASVFGGNGGDVRESFQGGKFLAKWDRKAWAMLVDTVAYVVWPKGKRGQWGVVRDDILDIFRAPNMSDAEAVDMAMSGVPVSGPVLGPQSGVRTLDMDSGHVQMSGTFGHAEAKAIERGVPLSDVLDSLPGQDGPDKLSIGGLRTASKRPGFPDPVPGVLGERGALLYLAEEIRAWRQEVLDRRG